MRHLYMKLLTAILLLLNVQNGVAAGPVDLGAMTMDTDYPLEIFKEYQGTFTPTESGMVTIQSTGTFILNPYYKLLDDMLTTGNAVPVTTNSYYPKSIDFTVEAGKTYYLYSNLSVFDPCTLRITKAATTLEKTSVKPEEGSAFSPTEGGQIDLVFNKAVKYSSATITSGSLSQKTGAITTNNTLTFDVKSIVYKWMSEGKVKAGDEFAINITGLRSVADENIQYGNDGNLSAKFVFGSMPLQLVSSTNTKGNFLSYYTSTDPAGIVSLTFSGPVSTCAGVELRYGDIDKDADGEYYVEKLPVTIDGNTISVNLQNKLRRASSMVTSGKDYGTMALGFINVRDQEGNCAYTSAQGSLGSFWYALTYKEVSASVACEFTPASGASLQNVSSMEIWLADEVKLSYDGINFAYTKDGEAKSVLVTDYTKAADAEYTGAAILTVPVPADIVGANHIVVSLHNIQCADGQDYSELFSAKYDAFLIMTTTPIKNSTLDALKAEQTIKVSTNMNAKIGYMPIVFRDMNPAEGEADVLFEGVMTKQTNNFTYTVPEYIRMVKGHEYHLEVTGYESEETYHAGKDAVGTDYALFKGASAPFAFSKIQLLSTTPDTLTVLSSGSASQFTMTFDGLVLLDAATNYVACSDGTTVALTDLKADNPTDGYSDVWTFSVPAATMKTIGSKLVLHLLAVDMDGLSVEGNTGLKDNNYLKLEYTVDITQGISSVVQPSNAADCVYSVTGMKMLNQNRTDSLKSLPAGVYISHGKKFVNSK